MNTFRHDEEQRRQWVLDKKYKRKSVKQICREAQISRATLYNWIDELTGEQPAVGEENAEEQQAKSEQSHQPENKTLPVHHATTKHHMLLAALEKVDTDKSLGRKLAAMLVKRFTLSITQACEIAGIDEATYGYKPRKPEVDDRLVQQSIVQLLAQNPAQSFDQCYDALRKANPGWTRKQIKRVYREGRLYLQRRRRSGKNADQSVLNFDMHPHRPGACWNVGMTAVENEWLLFLLDDADNVLLNTEQVATEPSGNQVINFLNRAMEENGKPRRLRIPAKAPFDVREITGWVFTNKLSVITLSINKPENELEIQGMEESAREQLKSLEKATWL